MKYPFTPEILDAMPEELAELFRDLELKLLEEICSRLNIADNLNEVTVQDIKALRSHGIDLKAIEKAIKNATGKSTDELNKLMDDVVERNQQYYTEAIDFAKVAQPQEIVSAADVERIRKQTEGEFTNITRSMGFLLTKGGKKVMLEPAKAYQWALDKAEMQIQSGAISYSQAISTAVKKLADSGIKTVNYESGHVDNVDVAVRRAVMTGISQLSDKYTEEAAKIIGTDYYEVSAHIGARDTGFGAANHKSWQGKVYSTRTKDKYPSIYEVCGLGTGEGLEGWNCRHRRFPYIDGISERTYTDEELDNIDPPPFEYEGRKYTAYEATQKQRMIERTARELKRRKAAFKSAGLKYEELSTGARLRRVNTKYKEFSKAAGLPEQPERMKVYVRQNKQAKTIEKPSLTTQKRVAQPPTRAIIQEKASGEKPVQTIGSIDIEKYKSVSDKIRTNEVVITDERIAHIKEHHPNDFEKYSAYIKDMVENPQYILEDKVPNTAVILKEFTENDEHFRLIMKLAVEGDDADKKNSVITFLKISEKKFKKYLRNKKILYKSE